jgi:catechol 2,3-dioxygenase-like lactoylglutathione lyase family enzyme
MTVQLNHTIVHATEPAASARFLADMLGLEARPQWGHFFPVEVGNGVTLDYMGDGGSFTPQHYAFLVDDDEFDAAHARMLEAGVATWADPGRSIPGEINHHFGGRGVYFEDPDGHLMEILTQPYGDVPE